MARKAISCAYLRCSLFLLFFGLSKAFTQSFDRVESLVGFSVLEENNGAAVADYDGDDDLDIFVVAIAKDDPSAPKTISRLFRNNNNGTFIEVAEDVWNHALPFFQETEVVEQPIDGKRLIYPVPVKNRIVNISNTSESDRMNLFDLCGRVVSISEVEFNTNTNTTTITLPTSLSSGMYLLSVNGEAQLIVIEE
jgi:hypothetical protein